MYDLGNKASCDESSIVFLKIKSTKSQGESVAFRLFREGAVCIILYIYNVYDTTNCAHLEGPQGCSIFIEINVKSVQISTVHSTYSGQQNYFKL